MNRDQYLFTIYLFLLVLFTSIHNIWYLLVAMVSIFMLSYKNLKYLFIRVSKTVWLSLLVISLSYLFMGLFKEIKLSFIVLLNIRVFLLTFMTFAMLERINIFNLLAFSKRLTSLVTLSFSQIYIFQRTFAEFQMGYTSRTLKPTLATWLKSLNATLFYFVNKTLHTSKDISLGMKSRGFFND